MRSPVNSPHKGQWCGTLMLSLICALNKRLGKQSWSCWFETPSRSLWSHCNAPLYHHSGYHYLKSFIPGDCKAKPHMSFIIHYIYINIYICIWIIFRVYGFAVFLFIKISAIYVQIMATQCYLSHLHLILSILLGPSYLTLIPAWISIYIHYKVLNEITYPIPNFNYRTVEVCQWIRNLTPRVIARVIIYLCWD